MKVTFPQDEEHCSLQDELILKTRSAEPVKETFNGVLRECELKVLSAFSCQVE
jgi:hypothetical protein